MPCQELTVQTSDIDMAPTDSCVATLEQVNLGEWENKRGNGGAKDSPTLPPSASDMC